MSETLFPGRLSSRGVKTTSHVHPTPGWRMSGAIPTVPHMFSYHAEGRLYCLPIHACFQTSAAKYTRTAPFWSVTQRMVVIPYRRFGTTYSSHHKGSSWILDIWIWGPIGCTETSVRNYHFSLRNSPEERRFQLFYTMENQREFDCSYFHCLSIQVYVSDRLR